MTNTTNSASAQAAWNDDFGTDTSLNSSLFPLKWGDSSEFSFGSAGLTITSNGTSAGFMEQDGSASDGSGYGTYSATFSMPSDQGAGAYICLWPGSGVWPGPEIDLVEESDGQGYLTVHWAGSGDSNAYHYQDFSANISSSTTVAVDWESSGLTFYVNGKQVGEDPSGGSVPVPKDYADGGQNESFGVGNTGASGTSITVSDMSYTPSSGGTTATSAASSTPAATTQAATTPAASPSTVDAASTSAVVTPDTWISVSSPAMQFMSNPAAGSNVPITFSDPGLKDVYALVMNSQNVAQSNWVKIPLNSSGQATHSFNFQHSGDYVLAVNDPNNQADHGTSAQISILQNS